MQAEAWLIAALRHLGDPRRTPDWPHCDPNYVVEYSLTVAHVPILVSLASHWGLDPLANEVAYGPVHAWRALGQMRATEAVQPLLAVQDQLDELGDDWYLEEFGRVFGLIGPPAIAALATYLTDAGHREFPRANAADGLREIAFLFPEKRRWVVATLTAELARHQRGLGSLNGLLVGDLIQLEAVESAETIERAYAANVVDPAVV